MRSLIVRNFGGPDVIELTETEVPEPGRGQVLIDVVASSVNPIDLSARAGRLAAAGLMSSTGDIGLGWDVAGTIRAVGAGVSRFRLGQEVIGLRDLLFAAGAHAEAVVLDESAVAPAPKSVSLTEAATLPLNALTADRALGLVGLSRGQTLLVTGAAGGVGGYILELAAVCGLHAIAVARPDDESLVRGLGAAEFVPACRPLADAVRRIVPGGVDGAIDAAVLGIEAHESVRSRGTFVALVAPFAPPPIRGTRVIVQEVHADGARLTELSALVDRGMLTPRVARELPLERASEAHALLEAGGVRGRIVLKP